MSGFPDELRFEPHGAYPVNLAVDVVIAFSQADVLDFGANLDHERGTFDLEILDHGDGVAILELVAIGIPNDAQFAGSI